MNKTIIKSIGAILTGLILSAALSITTDLCMSTAGIINTDNFKVNPSWLILFVISYRFLFNLMGCYLTAYLAPNNPMRHVMIIGSIGMILSTLGALAMWDQSMAWYNLSIIAIALPSAWLGGRLFLSKTNYGKTEN